MERYNLIVVGGGFAGVAAAISAARMGLKTLLVERGNCLGGAASHCLVNPFMPFWTKNDAGEKQHLSGGLFREILNKLTEMGAARNESVFHEEYLKLLLNRMVLESGAKLLFHSYLTDSNVQDGEIKSITVANKSGNMTLDADYFIDATGDGDLCVLSGCAFKLGRDADSLCQPMTMCFRVGNVYLEKYRIAKPGINPLYKEFQKQGKIKNIREDVLIFSNLVNGVLHFNSTRVVRRNPVDAFDLTQAEIDAREQVFELFNFLVENIDGFQNSQLLMTAPAIGVRESRMIEGIYTLTSDDLVSCTRFDDSIAAGNYDIDIHNPEGSGTSHYYFPNGQYYTIPYRCLIPRAVTNAWVAGRCVSATHEAQASIRIMPIVCCLGEAAGVAAAVAFDERATAHAADVVRIQKKLRENGAIL